MSGASVDILRGVGSCATLDPDRSKSCNTQTPQSPPNRGEHEQEPPRSVKGELIRAMFGNKVAAAGFLMGLGLALTHRELGERLGAALEAEGCPIQAGDRELADYERMCDGL